MIIASDKNDQITEFSPSALKVFGYQKADIPKIKLKNLYVDQKQHGSRLGFF